MAASDWIEWEGGDQPVADDVLVDVRFGEHEPETDTGIAGKWMWAHHRTIKRLDSHITAYRVVQA